MKTIHQHPGPDNDGQEPILRLVVDNSATAQETVELTGWSPAHIRVIVRRVCRQAWQQAARWGIGSPKYW